MADFERLEGETAKAFRAFTLFRDLAPQHRSLRAVCQTLALEQRASGLRVVSDDGRAERAPEERRKKEHGRVRATAWDDLVDERLRQKQLSAIEAMAARHASQSELSLEDLMRPILAFEKAMRDSAKRAAFEALPVPQLFQLCLSAAALLPRLQAAERLARGCRVVSNDRMAAPGSPQGPSEWRVSVYAPPREHTLASPADLAQMTDEWEEAEITPDLRCVSAPPRA